MEIQFDDRVLAHVQIVMSAKLRRGENFFFSWRDSPAVGDGRSAIWIDASGVSRRHALLIVEGDTVTIEDVGSSNGTFVHGRKLSARHRLADRAHGRAVGGASERRFQQIHDGGHSQQQLNQERYGQLV